MPDQEEEETDELLLLDEEMLDADPEDLPRRLLTNFAVYNAEVGDCMLFQPPHVHLYLLEQSNHLTGLTWPSGSWLSRKESYFQTSHDIMSLDNQNV